MAAREATWEARGSRDVPTLRLTREAGLEEDEEEDEEEAAAVRRAQNFARDARVRFLCGRLQQMLGIREETWSRYLESEDNRQVLGEFLERDSPACLVFSVTGAGQLAASREVRSKGTAVAPPGGVLS